MSPPVLSRISAGQGFSSTASYKRSFIARSAVSQYLIQRSLRFNSADSAYLSRNPASAGNRKTWTWAGWVKRAKLGVDASLFVVSNGTGGVSRGAFAFDTANKLQMWNNPSGGSETANFTTDAVFRDPSAWYHLLLQFDTTQSTNTERFKLFVNNVRQTFSSATYMAQNEDAAFNQAVSHFLGNYQNGLYGDFYLAEVHFVDGSALTPSSFTETDANGVLQPKAYTGSYGTNGFKLTFSDNATAAALGTDSSGNGNTWTVNNISVTNTAIYSGLASGSPDTGSYKPSNMWTAAGASNTSNVQTSGTTSASGGYGNSVYFDLSSNPISATSADLWILKDNNVGSYAAKIEINGTNLTPSVLTTGYSWVGVTGITSVTSIRIPYGAYCGAIRFNGVTFVEGQTTDSLVDSPSNYGTDDGLGGSVRGNYATLNPLDNPGNTLSNGNLDLAGLGNSFHGVRSTIGVTTGKWYFECTIVAEGGETRTGPGLYRPTDDLVGDYGNGTVVVYDYLGTLYVRDESGAGSTWYSTSGTVSAGDVFGFAFDLDAQKVWIHQNGTWLNSGNPGAGTGAVVSSLTSGTYFAGGWAYNTSDNLVFNFGQRAFAYTSNRSGFKALCTQNLPTPVIAQPSTAMDVVTYTGNGTTKTISGLGFSPDFVWIKQRSGTAKDHNVYDTIRGVTKELFPNDTGAENTLVDGLTAFNSDGYTFSSASRANGSGQTYVNWVWDAGSSTVTNTQGSINSQVRANQNSGFSIVTFTSPSSGNFTIGHGLGGVAPAFVLVKTRGTTSDWSVYHASATTATDKYLVLNSTAAVGTYSTIWGAALPTSAVIGLTSGGAVAASQTCVAYAFSPVAGYSSMGSYVASSGLPFVHLGFRPRFLLIKNITTASTNWRIIDSARDSYNDGAGAYWLKANTSDAETDERPVDFLSNGFKLRMTDAGDLNYSSDTYIYAAFAESPFAYARAR